MAQNLSRWKTLLTEAMIRQYTTSGEWAGTTIAELLDRLCDTNPDQPLIFDAGKSYTPRQLRRDALSLSDALHARGVEAGAVVSFLLPNWYEAIVVDLACAYGHYVCNPIVHIYRAAEVEFIIRDSQSRVLFVPEKFRNFGYAEMAEGLRLDWPHLKELVVVRGESATAVRFQDLLDEGKECTRQPYADPNDIKLLMYTSGTTSKPKGVLHTHNTIGAEIANFSRSLKLSRDDVVLMPSPLGHVTGYLYAIQMPVTLGCQAVLMDMWDAAKAADLIEQHMVTFTIGATPFVQEMADFCLRNARRLPSLRYFPSGGAPVPPEIIAAADKAFERCVTFRVYGSTEAPTVTLGVTERERRIARANTEGQVVGHEIRIIDPNGHDVPSGESGEIITRGPEVFVGYALPEQNDAFDEKGYFHTGDLAMRTQDDCIIITGRSKDLIIRGGENISPKEIEDILYTHPSVREVAVVAMPHNRLGETCCAYVTLRPGASFDFEAMTKILQDNGLAKQKYPERLEIVESLPYTASGKIQKNLLREQIAETLRREHAST